MAIYSAGRRRTILVLLLSSVLLITLDLRGNAVFNAARTAFNYALRPFEIAGEVVTRPVERAWDGITRVDDLQRENDLLQQQLDRQRSDQVAAQAALQENQELKRLLEISSISSYERKTCSIIGASPSNFDQRVEIDCGSTSGLRVGMPVVNDAGLVGKITTVSLDTSVVMLATDPLYAVPAKVMAKEEPAPTTTAPTSTVPSGLPVDEVTTTTTTTSTTAPPTSVPPSTEASGTASETASGESSTDGSVPGTTSPDGSVPDGTTTTTTEVLVTRETGKLNGLGGKLLPRVSLIDDSQAFGRINVGDAVLTAGGSDSLAPPNIPIGLVANVIRRDGVGGLELEVELNADLDRLNFLTVILYIPPREAAGL